MFETSDALTQHAVPGIAQSQESRTIDPSVDNTESGPSVKRRCVSRSDANIFNRSLLQRLVSELLSLLCDRDSSDIKDLGPAVS